jgi:site-specific recombinase XerD
LQQQQRQQDQITNNAYRNFVDTCKSKATRDLYTNGLKYFMAYLRIPPTMEGYDRLVNMDVKIIQANICEYVTYLRDKNKSHQTVSAYIAAIRHLYDMMMSYLSTGERFIILKVKKRKG